MHQTLGLRPGVCESVDSSLSFCTRKGGSSGTLPLAKAGILSGIFRIPASRQALRKQSRVPVPPDNQR